VAAAGASDGKPDIRRRPRRRDRRRGPDQGKVEQRLVLLERRARKVAFRALLVLEPRDDHAGESDFEDRPAEPIDPGRGLQARELGRHLPRLPFE
jgi:hypothetical protein